MKAIELRVIVPDDVDAVDLQRLLILDGALLSSVPLNVVGSSQGRDVVVPDMDQTYTGYALGERPGWVTDALMTGRPWGVKS